MAFACLFLYATVVSFIRIGGSISYFHPPSFFNIQLPTHTRSSVCSKKQKLHSFAIFDIWRDNICFLGCDSVNLYRLENVEFTTS